MTSKAFFICITVFLVAIVDAKHVSRKGSRVRRADDPDFISYVEDLLAEKLKEKQDKGSQCGKVDIQPAPLVTHGEKTEKGRWPWHIALYSYTGNAHSYRCGGSLIGRRTVVTAAHCVKDAYGATVPPETLVVYLGKFHLKFWTGVQEMQVSEVIVHPEYDSTIHYSDIAIMILSSPADYNHFVKPVCLWDDTREIQKDVPGSVVGWGRNENGTITGELTVAKMPIVSNYECIQSKKDFFSNFIKDKNFCAGYRNGTSACNGDSGGGMVFPSTIVSTRMQTWYLRGLVSLSVDKDFSCDTDHYIIFTDVAKYVDWIKENLR